MSPSAPLASRRDVLRTAGLITMSGGAVLTLAACGAGGQAGAASPTSSAPSSSAASPSPSSSTSQSESASSTPSTSQAPNGPSVATADVPVGGGVVLADADFVVTQPTKGTYKAFTKICTHRQCPVDRVADGVIHCNCHGSEFSITDGSVVKPPATKALAESATTVSGKKVYVTG